MIDSPRKQIILYFLLLISLSFYLVGFFPSRKSNLLLVKREQLQRKDETVQKLVLVVIDALRADFLHGDKYKTSLPFLQSSLHANKSCLINVRASAPTVTMPRIKAMTSGSIPNYFDIVMNFGSTEFHHDTFLRQAQLHGMRMVFYGDDTWLKLFPNMFTRSGGTHSFFAADFWEVDLNVTNSVTEELKRNDWDIMILHYLGLDHIGHMEGPQSKHVPKKLAEMDSVIRQIYLYLQDKGQYLLLVTGDHGMKDSGGHGGVTYPEIYVPLVSIGNNCRYLPGWPKATDYVPEQVDIASTISAALGLPIPMSNTGKIIPELLTFLQPTQFHQIFARLKSLLREHNNAYPADREVVDYLQKSKTNGDNQDETDSEVTYKYFVELSRLTEKLNNRDDFNLLYMSIGCSALWMLLIVTVVLLLKYLKPENALHGALFLGTIGHSISLASSSFIEEEHQSWYFLWTSLVLLSIRERWRRKIIVQSFVLDRKSCSLLILCVMHRLLRMLNQTGDKWAHLPDWGDYFREHEGLLFLFYISAMGWLYQNYSTSNQFPKKAVFLAALTCILLYRISISSFSFLVYYYPQSRGTFEVLALMIMIIVLKVPVPAREIRRQWLWAFLVITALTLRPHNLILLPSMLFASAQLNSVFRRDNTHFWNTLAHLWMGNVFYFYQGHSNSIANIDVAPAFIGCWSYIPIYGAFMTLIHTYAGPVLSLLLSPKSYAAILIFRLLPTTIYCTLTYFQRHHLFIWSVFSPKLLLDTCLTLVLFCVVCIHQIFSNKKEHH